MSENYLILSERTFRRQAAAEARGVVRDLELQSRNVARDNNNPDIQSAQSFMESEDSLTADHQGTEVQSDSEGASVDNSFMSNGNDSESDTHAYGEDSTDTDSVSDSDLESVDEEFEFADKLRHWLLTSNTPLVHANSLLALLKPFFPLLPKDARTLLHTKRVYDIENIAGGKYHHFGVESGIILKLLNLPYLHQLEEIYIQLNIDGLPLFKSTSHAFWPILGMIRQEIKPEPFVIGLWVGSSKPSHANDYLQYFIDEMKGITENGISFNNKIYKVSIENFVCDTPARSFVKWTKGHSGYHGCDFCVQRGQYYMHRMTFPEVNAALRTDVAFDEMQCEEHHHGESRLKELNIGMVTQFPLDYMHLICLGIVKKIINLWISGPLHVRIGGAAKLSLSNSLLAFGAFLPREFARKGRKITDIERWKATELRTFLLYTGPVALKGVVSDIVFKNFMMLSAGVFLLCNERLYKECWQHVEDIFISFVRHFGQLYGKEMIIYNVHALIHLPRMASQFGPLHNFSGFPFENYLQVLKKLVRKPKFPLQQVVRRLTERMHLESHTRENGVFCKKRHSRGPLHDILKPCTQFEQIQMSNFLLSLTVPDNAVLIGENTFIVKNIVCKDDLRFCVCQKFCTRQNLFNYPFDSCKLCVSIVDHLSERFYVFETKDIQTKVVLLPMKEGFASIPMI